MGDTIADHRNRRLLDLGKAYHHHAALCREETFRPAESLRDFVARFLASLDRVDPVLLVIDPPKDIITAFAARVVIIRAHRFCETAGWDVSLLNDACDDELLLRVALGYAHEGSDAVWHDEIRNKCPVADAEAYVARLRERRGWRAR